MELPSVKKGPGSRLMKDFESHKRDFGSCTDRDEIFKVNLQGGLPKDIEASANYDPDTQEIIFTWAEMLRFFEPAIQMILGLLEAQLLAVLQSGRRIDTLILAGGFGDSAHLQDQIRSWCEHNAHITLICPQNPQAAIVRGAAVRGLTNIKPAARKCRRHYGWKISRPFQLGTDPASRIYREEWTGLQCCKGVMNWSIKKGEKVDESTKITTEYFRTANRSESASFDILLYSSDSVTPPVYHNDLEVNRIGVIRVSLTRAETAKFPTKALKRRKVYKVEYEIEVNMGAEEGVLKFSATVNGRKVGSTEIDYTKLEDGLLLKNEADYE